MKYMTHRNRRRKAGSITDLSKLELAMLQHIARYRITTRSAWRGIWEFSLYSHDQLARTVRRLTSWGLIRRTVLFDSTHSFELDDFGVGLMGLPANRGKPLCGPALFRAYAQLLFATSRQLMLANRDELPILVERHGTSSVSPPAGLPWGHFFDPNDRSRWCCLIVDKQLRTKPNRVAVRVWRSIQTTPLWESGRCRPPLTGLRYAVITPSRRRALRIAERLRRFDGTAIPPIQLSVAPELIPLSKRNH